MMGFICGVLAVLAFQQVLDAIRYRRDVGEVLASERRAWGSRD